MTADPIPKHINLKYSAYNHASKLYDFLKEKCMFYEKNPYPRSAAAIQTNSLLVLLITSNNKHHFTVRQVYLTSIKCEANKTNSCRATLEYCKTYQSETLY